jgi:hypothetical protein
MEIGEVETDGVAQNAVQATRLYSLSVRLPRTVNGRLLRRDEIRFVRRWCFAVG